MKRLILGLLLAALLAVSMYAGETKKIFTDSDGKCVKASFNDEGIIEKIEGSVGNYTVNPVEITIKKNKIYLHSHNTLYLGEFDKIITKSDSKVEYSLIDSKTKEERKNTVLFGSPDYLFSDKYIKVQKGKDSAKSVYGDLQYSLLPGIEYENGVLSQYLVLKNYNEVSRKYVYSEDFKSVTCLFIMPGDQWGNPLPLSVADIRSEDFGVNLVNYMILFCYQKDLCALSFPILFMSGDKDSEYVSARFSADSYLTEGDTKYLPENLGVTKKGFPWAEGQKGDGIGSKISISAEKKIKELTISNGFVSEKKQIYFNNNRVKKIRISDKNNPKNKTVKEIPDSPEPFFIELGFSSTDIVIEVLEVYKGEKYDDTCINYILCK